MNDVVKKIGLYVCLAAFAAACSEQKPEEPNPVRRKSPIAIASVKHDGTYIKIVYGQPYKNGRTVFGDLIPYNEVWRTGANEATELTTTQAIWIDGKKLEEGTYSLFSIPGPEKWSILFNSELGQWGAFDYEPAGNLLQFEVPATKTSETTEVFTIRFADVAGDSTAILIKWAQTSLRIPVAFRAPA